MKIHEYQGKQLFGRYGIAIPKGIPAFTVDEAEAAAKRLTAETQNPIVVVKAQIHAGGRGKGGGVKVVKGGPAEVRTVAGKLLGSRLVTHQTGPEGQIVRRLYVEQGIDIARELYLALVTDRDSRRIAVIASTEGGVEIEKVAEEHPEKILKEFVEPTTGLTAFQARTLGFGLGLEKAQVGKFVDLLTKLYAMFLAEDCSLVEINPLVVLKSGDIVALDAKINFDDNAEFRHPEWKGLTDRDEEDPVELEAREAGLNYVTLDGNIGCMVNGAGLAMSTMDVIQLHGGKPANFLDVGGGANEKQVTKAFSMILSSPRVKGIFVNIFGGIMKCDIIAAGIVNAARGLDVKVPIVVRLEGTNVELGKKILAESGLTLLPADSIADGARKIVAAVQQGA